MKIKQFLSGINLFSQLQPYRIREKKKKKKNLNKIYKDKDKKGQRGNFSRAPSLIQVYILFLKHCDEKKLKLYPLNFI